VQWHSYSIKHPAASHNQWHTLYWTVTDNSGGHITGSATLPVMEITSAQPLPDINNDDNAAHYITTISPHAIDATEQQLSVRFY